MGESVADESFARESWSVAMESYAVVNNSIVGESVADESFARES